MARRVGERPIDAGPPPRRQTQRAGPALRLPDAAGDDPTFAEEADIDEICGSRAIAEDRLGRSRIDRYLDLAAVRNEARAQARIVKEALDQFRAVFETLQSRACCERRPISPGYCRRSPAERERPARVAIPIRSTGRRVDDGSAHPGIAERCWRNCSPSARRCQSNGSSSMRGATCPLASDVLRR